MLRSRAMLVFLAIEVVAAGILMARRGSEMLSTVVLVWLGMAALAFFAWWAGRHRLAHPEPDPMPSAPARSAFALLGIAGTVVWGTGISIPAGFVLFACGMGGWLWSAFRADEGIDLRGRLLRDPRPLVPLLLLIAIPRLVVGGPLFVLEAVLALPSGIGQQLLYLVGLYSPLEGLGRDRASMAVVAALLFGLVHVPIVLDANSGDLLAALGNAVIFQSSVGIIACLAYQRHRAVVPIGVAHALAIA
jgi:hypothetical protein